MTLVVVLWWQLYSLTSDASSHLLNFRRKAAQSRWVPKPLAWLQTKSGKEMTTEQRREGWRENGKCSE